MQNKIIIGLVSTAIVVFLFYFLYYSEAMLNEKEGDEHKVGSATSEKVEVGSNAMLKVENKFFLKENSSQADTQELTEIVDLSLNEEIVVECPELYGDEESYEKYLAHRDGIEKQFRLKLGNIEDERFEYFNLVFDLSSEFHRRIEQINKFKSKHPNFELVNILLAESCDVIKDNTKCIDLYEHSISEYGSHNGAEWYVLASLKAEKGDVQGMLEAMKYAATVPIYNEYYADQILMYVSILEELGIGNHFDRAQIAISYTKLNIGPQTELFKLCKDGEQTEDIIEACFQLGRRLESDSQTLITQRLGQRLIEYSSKNLGLTEEHERVKQRIELSKKRFSSDPYRSSQKLLMYDAELLANWQNNLNNYGEVKSLELLIEDAVKFSSRAGYNPCP